MERGNCIRNLSPGVSLVASDNTWIEGNAIQQLQTTARLPDMHHVCGMPDPHPGRGYPVGATFFTCERLYPALVGNDIGCGMALWQTDIAAARPDLDKLEKRIGNIDQPLDQDWAEHLQDLAPAEQRSANSSPETAAAFNHVNTLVRANDTLLQSAMAAQDTLIKLVLEDAVQEQRTGYGASGGYAMGAHTNALALRSDV